MTGVDAFFQWLAANEHASNSFRNFAIGLGIIPVSIGLWLAHRRTKAQEEKNRLSEEARLNERFAKAIELLGSTEIDVRVGAIFVLEKIAAESAQDHWTVMETLTAFARNRKTPGVENETPTDLEAAIKVMGRRNRNRDPEGAKINLDGSTLSGIDFTSLDPFE